MMVRKRNDGQDHLKDLARTPPGLFKIFNDIHHYELDAFCNRDNCLCDAGMWHDCRIDALEEDWENWVSRDGTVFGNPIYSNPAPFIKKSYEESLKGIEVSLLIPSDTSTISYHKYCMKARDIVFIYPRVHFLNPDGTRMAGSPQFGSMVVTFKQDEFDGSPLVNSLEWRG